MKLWTLALVLAACGGGSKKSAAPVEPTATGAVTCAAVADNMAAQVLARKNQPARDRIEAITEIIRTRCDQDAWSAEAKQCLATMKTDDEADQCAKYLTEQQLTAMVQAERERFGKTDEGGAPPPPPMAPGGAPAPVSAPPVAPSPAPRSPSRGIKPKPKADPCQGGESDPCQGGEKK